MPSFGSWINLQALELQASGFGGPIPPSISVLKNMIDLITDLNRGASQFPNLINMTRIKRLVLRSCNISGRIPYFLAQMPALQHLDLSMLEGEIPNLESLSKLEHMYLMGNSLNGTVQHWMRNRPTKLRIDLSYNNLNESSVPSTCQDTLNLFRSYRPSNALDLAKCLNPCSKDYYSFHINCGGPRTTVGETIFEEDDEEFGSAKFDHSKESWGSSRTGTFLDTNETRGVYVAKNVSVLRLDDPTLYMTARQSPLSLTYYGRCLANGNYSVTLHFAEIVFRDNSSFQSLGRRMFDVYIQGELKVKDFDIEQVAEGVDKVTKQRFTALVKNKTLEIRFQYSGKGTTLVPSRGTYGPLVSAISVESDFKPPSSHRKRKIIATVAALLTILLILVVTCWWSKYMRRKISNEQELRELDLHTRLFFTYRQIRAATNDFDSANKIGEGGFGSVYKGTLSDGSIIAVKQLSPRSSQGKREFVNEIGTISALDHPNLLKLYGCCVERSQLLLVYEYMENNSLDRALFGPDEFRLELDWSTRQKICLGVANGLCFLHEESFLKIVHRDIKASNVLLDRDLNPKISDFGLARLNAEDHTHINTGMAGTIGYMAPEYAMYGHLTYKADVYSFGVMTLEIVAGTKNLDFHGNQNFVCLLDWALFLQKRGSLIDLVDPRLSSNTIRDEAEKMIRVALLCTSPSPALRPTMSQVVSLLRGIISIQHFNLDPSIYDAELAVRALRDQQGRLEFDVIHTSSSSHTSFRSARSTLSSHGCSTSYCEITEDD